MAREGCPDLDPMWPGADGRPRGPTLCVLYPRCECGDIDKGRASEVRERATYVSLGGEAYALNLATAYRPEVPDVR